MDYRSTISGNDVQSHKGLLAPLVMKQFESSSTGLGEPQPWAGPKMRDFTIMNIIVTLQLNRFQTTNSLLKSARGESEP